MMIFGNAPQKSAAVNPASVCAFLQLLAPFAPHIAEELWSRLGQTEAILTHPWPVFEAHRLTATEVKIVFQVNGKHRGDQLVSIGLSQDAAVALAQANPRVSPHLEGKAIKRVIFVPGKILNIVTV